MLVFGIDPGSTATGYAALRRVAGRYVLDAVGVIRTRSSEPLPIRLRTIYRGLTEVIAQVEPDCVAIESIFKHRSSESALRLGQARGVALLAAAEHNLEVTAYNPMTVKKTIGGHGRAGKKEMVNLVSRLVNSEKPLASDAADATAIAMTHFVNHAWGRS